MNNENTQLTSASGYETKRMIFSEAQTGSIPNSKPEISFKRITISTKNEDGTVGALILPTSKLFSFGVSENLSMDTGKVNGYVMPLCLHNRDGATQEEKEWTETFNNIVDQCKEHLIENKDEIEKYDLEMNDLKKFNSLYYKKEKGKIVEGMGPTLYGKLIVSKKQDKIITMFYDFDGESIDPLTLLGKYCNVKAAVKIESIFIGNKISLQVKLYECEVKLLQTGMKRLMKRPKAQQRVLNSTPMKASNPLEETKETETDDINDSESDTEDTPVAKKKPVKKRRVKVVKRRATTGTD
jgi:hypothetical protein